MKTCPRCNSKKTITITVHQNGGTSTETLPCITCEGHGDVTDGQYANYKAEQEVWCRCGNPSGETQFYDDGEHPEIAKHHWRCGDCSKVVQIG